MKALRKYLITLACGLVGALLIFWLKDIFNQTEPVVIFHILSDGFFAVGTVITAMGLLIFTTNEGTFDMIVYGMGSFFGMFRKNHTRKYETFYDYRVSRAEKKVKFGFLVFCGLIYLALAIIMYFIYRGYC